MGKVDAFPEPFGHHFNLVLVEDMGQVFDFVYLFKWL
jgi:hypothetical protein